MKNNLDLSPQEIDYLFSPQAIRDSAQKVFNLTEQGKTHFVYHPEKIQKTADYVLKVIMKNYPNLKIPFHSRWGHFKVGDFDRVQLLNEKISKFDPYERARIKLDLVIPSVLLDAGAGDNWSYLEKETKKVFSRSEGLGLASFYMFLAGNMSDDHKSLRADSLALSKIKETDLKAAFQVDEKNKLNGLAGRVALLNNLGSALQNKIFFKDARPGNILDYLIGKYGKTIPAPGILRAVLDGFGSIWPGRLQAGNINLGDVWQHSLVALVPFHKLSQWMTYSLIEPIVEAGLTVTQVEELTGLAEYRNGGLFLDMGVIALKDTDDPGKKFSPEMDLIIEWRALTIYLLDQIAEKIQNALGKSPQEFPLAKVLEGGTWWAGRFIAQEKRKNGTPPLQIQSDGTVF